MLVVFELEREGKIEPEALFRRRMRLEEEIHLPNCISDSILALSAYKRG
jgi:hypothetical protein